MWEGKYRLARSTSIDDIYLLPQKACRHGVIAGMNNYEVTLAAQVLAEGFSNLGVPVSWQMIQASLKEW